MAIKAIPLSGKVRYIGLSGDTKPTAAAHSSLPAPEIGSTYLESDTADLYITYNGTNWVIKDSNYARLVAIETAVELIDNMISGSEAQVDVVAALPAGTNIVGKVGIDQTTPGTTNAVVEASAAAIKIALEIIDNFISGSRGLVTEDSGVAIKTAMEAVNTALQTAGITQVQLAAIKTALELIDNAISGTEIQADIVAALPAGTNTIGGTNPPAVDKTHKPFGKGSLTTSGIQYSAEVAGIGDAYTAIETVTIQQPANHTLEEIEFALTVAIKSSSTVEGVNWKMQASDNGTDWQDLIAEQIRAADASAYADVSASGRFAPTTNFLGTGSSFQVRAVVKSAVAAGETASGKMKNSSYIICKYRRS